MLALGQRWEESCKAGKHGSGERVQLPACMHAAAAPAAARAPRPEERGCHGQRRHRRLSTPPTGRTQPPVGPRAAKAKQVPAGGERDGRGAAGSWVKGRDSEKTKGRAPTARAPTARARLRCTHVPPTGHPRSSSAASATGPPKKWHCSCRATIPLVTRASPTCSAQGPAPHTPPPPPKAALAEAAEAAAAWRRRCHRRLWPK
jgi:hypothetical protein